LTLRFTLQSASTKVGIVPTEVANYDTTASLERYAAGVAEDPLAGVPFAEGAAVVLVGDFLPVFEMMIAEATTATRSKCLM
jgi:hypothetical protein